MEIFKSIVTNVLTALYQPFWFAVLLTIFILFFYMYAYHPIDTGKGIKSACLAWIRTFKNSLFFRKLFCLIFFTVMILFRTLLNRNMWMNEYSRAMKSHFRKFGNQMSGSGNHLCNYASLLA